MIEAVGAITNRYVLPLIGADSSRVAQFEIEVIVYLSFWIDEHWLDALAIHSVSLRDRGSRDIKEGWNQIRVLQQIAGHGSRLDHTGPANDAGDCSTIVIMQRKLSFRAVVG